MTLRNTHSQSLTPLQQAILDVLWARGAATAEVVRDALAPNHLLKDSSIRTMLRRLEARGVVTHTADGKVFVYKAAIRPGRMAARAVQQIIQRFWAGSVEQFLIGMVDEQVLPTEEIERLAKKVKSVRRGR